MLPRVLGTTAFILIVSLTFAQVPSQNNGALIPREQIIPPTPNAASIEQYDNYPVDLSTGVPLIEIPIYNVQSSQLSLPISISYHASGNRVDDIPGIIGLGWTLKAGGAISRSVRGNPDFESPRTTNITANDITAATDESTLSGINYDISMGYLDAESDIYSYNAGNISGTFMYNRAKQLIQIPNTDSKITGETRTGYTIVANDGTIYVFKDGEKNVTSIEHNASLFLTMMISADHQDTISFKYKRPDIVYRDRDITTVLWKGRSVPGSLEEQQQQFPNVTSWTDRTELLLEEITFHGGKVIFEITDDRLDRRKHRLKSIKVFKSGTQEPSVSVDLFHSYFTSTPFNSGSVQNNLKRLKLEKLSFHSSSNGLKNYLFQYNQTKLPPYYGSVTHPEFPNDLTEDPYYFGQDYWGYANGVLSNKHFVPTRAWQNLWITPANREPSEEYMKACIIEKITYPTGGFTKFEFEANRDQNNSIQGGLRIKKMSSFDPYSTLLKEKEYEYTSEGSVFPRYYENYAFYHYRLLYRGIRNTPDFADLLEAPRLFITSNPSIPQSIIGGPSTLYSMVTEYNGSKARNIGKKEYIYDWTPNEVTYAPGDEQVIGSGVFSVTPRYQAYVKDNFWKRGQLLEERFYKKTESGYELLKTTVNQYQIFNRKPELIGTVVIRKFIESVEGEYPPSAGMDINSRSNYWYFDILIDQGVKKLASTSTIEYEDGVPKITVGQTFTYEKATSSDYRHLNVTSATTTKSNGDLVITKYQYPLDFTIPPNTSGQDALVINQFLTKNMNASPIERLIYIKKGSNEPLLIGGEFVKWSLFDQTVRPSQYFKIETASPFAYTGASLDQSGGFVLSEKHQKKSVFNLYNTMGNPLQITGNDGIVQSFIWGYNYLYPIAKVTGADYTQVKTALGLSSGTSNNLVYLQGYTESQLEAELTKLRNNLKNSVPNAQVASYLYKPLVGISKQIDPNGQQVKYDYDSFNRLKSILDHNDDIITNYQYHYSNLKVFENAEASVYFTKNDCGPDLRGGPYLYTVPAGKHFSRFSQADADQKALDDISTNGQIYANANAACLPLFYNTVQSKDFIRSNCGSGMIGSPVTYTVAAGSYSSAVNQVDADQKALNDINQNGQAYANQNGTCTQRYYNTTQSRSFTRNNCTGGYIGGTMTYTVPANTYSSSVSQADADQMAVNDINANGQTFVNANTTCTEPPYINVTCTTSGSAKSTKFTIRFINQANQGPSYTFTMNVNQLNGVIGKIYSGVYRVIIDPTPPAATSYSYRVYTASSRSYQFDASNLYLTCSSCAQVTIDP
jgi:YD repeat-containing protein